MAELCGSAALGPNSQFFADILVGLRQFMLIVEQVDDGPLAVIVVGQRV